MLLRHLPNLITLMRALAGIGGAWMLLHSRALSLTEDPMLESAAIIWGLASFGLLILAAASDFLDGWAARMLRSESRLGALLDPIADKVLVAAYFIAFVIIAGFDPYLMAAVAIIIGRDVIVTGLRLTRLGQVSAPLPVSPEAKFKTGLQMILLTLPFLLVILGLRDIGAWFYYWVGGVWLASLMSLSTAWPYLRQALRR